MDKLTTERLEYYAALPTQPAEGDGFFKKGIFMYEVRRMARRLLAYEQAAKNPVAWIVHMRTGDQFTTDGDFVGLGEATHGIHSTPLYAAPVIPKQTEPVDLSQQVEILNRILNWILKELPVPTKKASAMAIRLSSVIDIISDLEVSAPAQEQK